jgi:hypothetical protein
MSIRSLRLQHLLVALLASGCAGAPPAPASDPPPAPDAPLRPSAAPAAETPSTPAPPVARKEFHVVDLANGTKAVDDYFWLRRKDAPEVLAHRLRSVQRGSTAGRPLRGD